MRTILEAAEDSLTVTEDMEAGGGGWRGPGQGIPLLQGGKLQ
jgi:hypothetical protein